MNIGKYFWRLSSSADLVPALQVSDNLMPEMPFYFKLKFLVENLSNYTSKVFHKSKCAP